MMRLRRASVIAALSLLAWAATASAECAWVLWQQSLPPNSSQYEWDVIEGYPDHASCEQAQVGWFNRAKQRKRDWVYPDTVDPRGPKGK